MKQIHIALTVILGLAVVGIGVYLFMVMGERDDLQKELIATRENLASTQQQVETLQTTLDSTQGELATTKDTLTSTQANLNSTNEILATTQNELNATEDELSTTRDELDTTKSELTETKLDLTLTETRLDDTNEELEEVTEHYQIALETLQGLDITLASSAECYDVELVDNPEATNPSWIELKAFLAEDLTEQHEYITDEYDCSQFSRDLHNRAEAAGIRAAEVHIVFKGESTGHALNAFLTTDYGLVYVDCTEQPDKAAQIKSGYVYRAVSINLISIGNIRNDSWWNSRWTYYYIPSSKGGQVEVSGIRIYW